MGKSWWVVGLYAWTTLGIAAPGTVEYTAVEYPRIERAQFAEHWQLSLEEFERYQHYMALEGRYFYAHLDPVTVLGLIETDPVRQQHYATLYLRQERQRIAQQTGFAALVAARQMQLYGAERVFDFSTLPQAANSPGYQAARQGERTHRAPPPDDYGVFAPQAGDSVDLLVTPACQTVCFELLDALVATPVERINIYGYGFTDIAALAAWLTAWPKSREVQERLQLKRFDPLIFTTAERPQVLLRRDGMVVARR